MEKNKIKHGLSISKWAWHRSSLLNMGEDHNSVCAAHSQGVKDLSLLPFFPTAPTSLARSSSHQNRNCSAPLLCISHDSWLTELQRGQHSVGHWEAKHQSDSLIMGTSRRQESGSHSVTACIFPFQSPPIITYLPRAQYSWSARDRDTLRQSQVRHLVSDTSSSHHLSQELLPQPTGFIIS